MPSKSPRYMASPSISPKKFDFAKHHDLGLTMSCVRARFLAHVILPKTAVDHRKQIKMCSLFRLFGDLRDLHVFQGWRVVSCHTTDPHYCLTSIREFHPMVKSMISDACLAFVLKLSLVLVVGLGIGVAVGVGAGVGDGSGVGSGVVGGVAWIRWLLRFRNCRFQRFLRFYNRFLQGL